MDGCLRSEIQCPVNIRQLPSRPTTRPMTRPAGEAIKVCIAFRTMICRPCSSTELMNVVYKVGKWASPEPCILKVNVESLMNVSPTCIHITVRY